MAPAVLLVFLLRVLFIPTSAGGPQHREFLYPNFTASNLDYVDSGGIFLISPNSTFQASICNPAKQQSSGFYLCVIHAATAVIVWVANPSAPISSHDVLALSPTTLSLSVVWSTPPLKRPVSALRLLDSGNLLLLDSSNSTLWQSFDYPTDTFVSGQLLRSGSGHALTSYVSDTNLSKGDYTMDVTANDAVLRWKGTHQYWSMSGDVRAYRNSDAAAACLGMNSTGLFLFSDGGYILKAPLPAAELHIAKLTAGTGQLVIQSYASASSAATVGTFSVPAGNCELPFVCKALGLCLQGSNNFSSCGCADGFLQSTAGGCVPSGVNYSLPSASSCRSGSSSPRGLFYRRLPDGVEYFAGNFESHAVTDGNVSSCTQLCSSDCKCLGFYYHKNTSGPCFLLRDELGSLYSAAGGYIAYHIKLVVSNSTPSPEGRSSDKSSSALLPILLPLLVTALLLLVLLLFLLFRRRGTKRGRVVKTNVYKTKLSSADDGMWPREEEADEEVDDGDISIPGLPARFTYEELEAATDGFGHRIGSGGFGVVYKGVLRDNSTVAVKRLVGMGVRGRKEFCTEIAVIGSIHHVNLLRLRGFCAQGCRRMLVYDYMNRGSLDRSLFAAHGKPVMEWQERVDVAVGAARGLAYLHGGCDQKIIHCDVKPENILLHDNGGVKISDFGLSKLLSPEQTSLVTTLRGTRGYLAPEWLTSSPISDRTDVYSFGMVLLELVHGRKNCPPSRTTGVYNRSGLSDADADADAATFSGDTISTIDGESYFPLVALEKHEEKCYDMLVDPRLRGRVTTMEVERVVKVALCCLHEEPARRPSMELVVGMLEGSRPVWEPRLESLTFLKFYGRGTAESAAADSAAMATTATANRDYYEILGSNTMSITKNTISLDARTADHVSHLASEHVSGPR